MAECKLIGLSHGIEGKEFTLTGRLTVGRADDNQIIVKEAGISRHHAEFSVLGSRVTLRDLGSANGSKVNGVLVVKQELNSGDRIRVADVEFLFISSSAKPVAVAAPTATAPADSEQTAFIEMPDFLKNDSPPKQPQPENKTEFVDMSKLAVSSDPQAAPAQVDMSDIRSTTAPPSEANATSFVDMKEVFGNQPPEAQKPSAATPAIAPKPAAIVPPGEKKASPFLLVYKLEGKEQRHHVQTGSIIIGRDSVCDLVISDVSISQRHARITFDGTFLQVEDLGTASGVYVNLEKVHAPRMVRPGDEILIGRFSVYCRRAAVEETGAQASAAPSEKKGGFFAWLKRLFGGK